MKIFSGLIFVLLLAGCAGSKIKKSLSSNFFEEEKMLIMGAKRNEPMRIYKIDNYEDSLLLRKPSQSVLPNTNDQVLRHLIDRLYSTVRDSLSMGVGIAAPQVGVLKQIIWIQRFDKEGFPFEYYLNPEIVAYSEEKQDCREGCLSIPNLVDTTQTRSKKIEIRYDQLDQIAITETIDGFTAVIFQHEIDHLDGILFIDHLQKETSELK